MASGRPWAGVRFTEGGGLSNIKLLIHFLLSLTIGRVITKTTLRDIFKCIIIYLGYVGAFI